jgi:hypothetical protein
MGMSEVDGQYKSTNTEQAENNSVFKHKAQDRFNRADL